MQDKLNAEIEAHNNIVKEIQDVRAKLEELESERLQRLGRVNMLSELISQESEAAADEVVSGEVVDEATKTDDTQE